MFWRCFRPRRRSWSTRPPAARSPPDARRCSTRSRKRGGCSPTRVVDSVYLGGVDSLVDREPIDRALRAGQLKVGTAEGFVPGEGAAFLRLGVSLEDGTLGILSGRASASEPAPRGAPEANSGEGLARAGRGAVKDAGISMSEVGAVFHDASGDRFGFREAGMALVRLRPRAEPAPQVWAPATCTGEIGAASGPFALAAAATFLHRKVSPGPAALILGTGDRTMIRGAAVVTLPAPQPPRRR